MFGTSLKEMAVSQRSSLPDLLIQHHPLDTATCINNDPIVVHPAGLSTKDPSRIHLDPETLFMFTVRHWIPGMPSHDPFTRLGRLAHIHDRQTSHELVSNRTTPTRLTKQFQSFPFVRPIEGLQRSPFPTYSAVANFYDFQQRPSK
jgi:hypothetical protein